MIEIDSQDERAVPTLAPLWLALFDHHIEIGSAGLETIERHRSWPLRAAHYRHLFESQPFAAIWTAQREGQVLGYALAYEDLVDGRRAMVLETLSVLPAGRGQGIGTRLMSTVDAQAHQLGIEVAVIDVMGGNARARELLFLTDRGFKRSTERLLR